MFSTAEYIYEFKLVTILCRALMATASTFFPQNLVERCMARGPWKRPLDFGDNPDLVTLGLWLDGGTALYTRRLPAICLIATILRYQRHWLKYALYRMPFSFT